MATSLAHTDVTRPIIEVSPLPSTIALDIAASDAIYISPAEQKAAVTRVTKSKFPLFCGGTKKYAALTFDDGPSTTTPQLIKLLKDEGIPATWFDIGKNAQTFGANLKLQSQYGPIADHTWSHPDLTTLSPADIKTELGDTRELLKTAVGQDTGMMRPPYGARNAQTEKIINKMGFAEILWSADSQDGLGKPWQVIAQNALAGLGPGSNILFHDGPAATLVALKKKIIPAIRRSGLTMVTVPEMLVLNPPSDQQLASGAMGCSHAGRVNVSGTFLANPEAR